ncbi:uncharacterized protein PG986_006479 [Apiospora aurea]|uniref:Uncharacterized protein n=1 Tax=Apiospora aurea TaxID=335848 RepID=A0ABR1QKJ1_9PEZI
MGFRSFFGLTKKKKEKRKKRRGGRSSSDDDEEWRTQDPYMPSVVRAHVTRHFRDRGDYRFSRLLGVGGYGMIALLENPNKNPRRGWFSSGP